MSIFNPGTKFRSSKIKLSDANVSWEFFRVDEETGKEDILAVVQTEGLVEILAAIDEKPTIAVILEGGVVHDAVAINDAALGCTLLIVDYDIEEQDPSENVFKLHHFSGPGTVYDEVYCNSVPVAKSTYIDFERLLKDYKKSIAE